MRQLHAQDHPLANRLGTMSTLDQRSLIHRERRLAVRIFSSLDQKGRLCGNDDCESQIWLDTSPQLSMPGTAQALVLSGEAISSPHNRTFWAARGVFPTEARTTVPFGHDQQQVNTRTSLPHRIKQGFEFLLAVDIERSITMSPQRIDGTKRIVQRSSDLRTGHSLGNFHQNEGF